MDTKKIGLMGCGVVAGYGHLPVLVKSEGLSLHALYDPVDANLRAAQERFGVPLGFTDAQAFFNSGIDAVTITSPAPRHRENVLECARRRLPVLCEKPLAMNATEGREMVEAMRNAGVSLHVGFCYRFSPSALKIRELVQSGAIGDVRSLRLIYNWDLGGKFETNAKGEKVLQSRREGRMFEGGPMVDCGTHQIDLALFWLGSPIVRQASHGAWVDEYEAPDHMWLHLDHANGAHTVVEISYSYGHTLPKKPQHEFVYELIGSKGIIRYDRGNKRLTLMNENGHQELPYHHEKDFGGVYKAWSETLRLGTKGMLTTGEEGVIVDNIARTATEEAIRQRLR